MNNEILFQYLQTDRIRSRVINILWLAVYRQSVLLGAKPLETHDQIFFQLNLCDHRPYVTSSLKRGWVCLLQIGFSFYKCKSKWKSKSKLLYNWWFTAIQLVLAPSPLRLMTRDIFAIELLWSKSCLTRGWVCLSWICLALCQVSVLHIRIACYWKFLLLRYVQVLSQSRLCKADHAYLPYLVTYIK
jgi:hypothetical protein